MEQTLIIYDDNGRIFGNVTNDFVIPVGLQHIITVIPEGKRIASVDVSASPHQVVLEDIPPSEIKVLNDKLDNALIELTTLISMGGM